MVTASPQVSSLRPLRLLVAVTGLLALMLFQAFALAPKANAQTLPPTFIKTFSPSTIGPGSVSTLQFTITNNTASFVTGLAFTDVLPAGMTIASPANASTTCTGGTLDAPIGGTTISYSGGSVSANRSCLIKVNVTSSTVGTHTNTTGDLTSSAGNSGTATADLTIATDRPGFTKRFSPSSVSFGGRSTLTFTIDNTLNGAAASNLAFTDNLPVGMTVASPANASTNCGTAAIPAILTAGAGTSVITLQANGNGSFPALNAGATCTVTVDIVGNNIGSLGNTTGELTSGTSTVVSSGKAGAVLTVTQNVFSFTKTFTNDPVGPGGTVTLAFSITNLNRRFAANNISFDDPLPAGLTFSALVSDDCGGVLDTATPSLLAYSGGILPREGPCTLIVTLDVPTDTAPDTYTNTTTAITAEVEGEPVTGGVATDNLFVVASPPTLTKAFTDDPVSAGGEVTLAFTITNGSAALSLSDIAFEDVFVDELPTASSVPANGSACGSGSVFTYTERTNPPAPSSSVPARLAVSGASLGPGASCTFSVTLDVDESAANGTYPNVTSAITGLLDGEVAVEGNPATDNLVIVAPPNFSKIFTDDPVSPGGTVTLEFRLQHSAEAPTDATGIAFTDDLNNVLDDLVAVGLPLNDICGSGSSLTGTTGTNGSTVLNFSGGTLAPGEACVFSVTLDVAVDATAGTYLNKTENITATVAGLNVTGDAAFDNLLVSPLSFTKEFTDDPVAPGGTVTLAFTLTNSGSGSEGAGAATGINFSDDLDDMLSGLESTSGPQNDVCGTGSEISGVDLLSFTGGMLAAGASCTFSVLLSVPVGATPDTYLNVTSNLTATIGGSSVVLSPASDELVVATSSSLSFTKAFTDDPATPGGPVTLAFTITNDGSETATDIAFTDNLVVVLADLVSTSGTQNDVCGTGSEISGTSLLTFTGGTLDPSESCTFNVTLSVPGAAPFGAVFTNITSPITGVSGGVGVSGDPATDNLVIINDPSGGPTANAGPDQGVECTDAEAPAGTAVTLDGTGSSGEELTYTWLEGGAVIATGATASVDLPFGTHTITLIVRAVGGGQDSDEVVIDVVDTAGPAITFLTPFPEDPLQCGIDTFDVPGATAFDACEGPITVEIDGTVDTGTPGTYTVTYTASDSQENTTTETPTVTVEDTLPPVITIDPLNPFPTNPLECAVDTFTVPGATAVDACDGPVDVEIEGTVDTTAPGAYPITYTASDLNPDPPGPNVATETHTVIVEDTLPPVIEVNGDPISLWPANHSYHSFGITDLVTSVSDICDQTLTLADVIVPSAYSDEPENGNGDGNTLNDIVISEPDCASVDVRAERQGGGNGRVYTIDLDLTDASDNTGSAFFDIQVPHNKKDTAIKDTPPAYVVTASCTANIKTFEIAVVEGDGVTKGDKEAKVTEEAKAVDDVEASEQADEAEATDEADVAADVEQDEPAEMVEIAEAAEEVPTEYILYGNYPNPFNPGTMIRFGLPEAAAVRLVVYDILGRRVRVLLDGVRKAGTHEVAFNARGLPSGTYLYLLETPQGNLSGTMLLMK